VPAERSTQAGDICRAGGGGRLLEADYPLLSCRGGQARVDPEETPSGRLFGLEASVRAGLSMMWLMVEGLTVARLVAQFLNSSGIPHALAGDPVKRLVVFTNDGPEWALR
jgi:hypothetical protein